MTLLMMMAPHAPSVGGDTPGIGAVGGPRRVGIGRKLSAHISASLAGTGSFAPGAVSLGSWHDVQAPTYDISFDGTGPLTLTLGRAWGKADEPDEGGLGSLAMFRRIDLYVSDAYTLTDGTLSRHIYRGTVAQIRRRYGTGWSYDVGVVPLTRLLGSFVASTVLVGDAIAVLSGLVTTYGGGLGWDARNPTVSDVSIPSVFRINRTLGSLMAEITTLLGPSWHTWVTPQGLVRVANDTELSATVHDLTLGVEATEPDLETSTLDYASRVYVRYTDPSDVPQIASAVADDFNAADPYDYVETLPGQVPFAYAQDYADALLLARYRILSRGSVRVLADRYPTHTFDVGHLINLQVERAIPAITVAGQFDPYGLQIAQVQHEWDSTVVHFATPERNVLSQTRYFWMRLGAFMAANQTG